MSATEVPATSAATERNFLCSLVVKAEWKVTAYRLPNPTEKAFVIFCSVSFNLKPLIMSEVRTPLGVDSYLIVYDWVSEKNCIYKFIFFLAIIIVKLH